MKPSITVFGITNGYRFKEHVHAITETYKNLPPYIRQNADMLLVCPKRPDGYKGQWLPLPYKPEEFNYSKAQPFVITDLSNYISTDFVINTHWDGYALNKFGWTDEFFNYDYIGAPIFPPKNLLLNLLIPRTRNRVGSGGFSFRSKKWLEIGKSAPKWNGENEDVFMCRKYVKHWMESGCKIAPVELALKWAVEYSQSDFKNWNPEDSFGFHGFLPNGKKRSTVCLSLLPTLIDYALDKIKGNKIGYFKKMQECKKFTT